MNNDEAIKILNDHVSKCEDELEIKMDIMEHDARCYALYPNEAHNDNHGLAAAAGFTNVNIDRNDYQDEPQQHDKFAVHCVVAIAAIVIAVSTIGLARCFYFDPGCALRGAFFTSTGLFGVWLFQKVEHQLWPRRG